MKKLRAFFGFSPAEARGVLLLVCLLCLSFLFPLLYEFYISSHPQPVPEADRRALDSFALSIKAIPIEMGEKNEEKDSFKDEHYTPAQHTSPRNPVAFDPNTASSEVLEQNGIPRFLVNRMKKYREKGGKFRYKEDVQRIYDFPPALYASIASLIQLPSKEEKAFQAPAQAEKPVFEAKTNAEMPTASAPTAAVARPVTKASLTAFDLNTADTTQLKAINGIGSGYARRIIKYREELGGFLNKEQVKETFGLPPETADELLKYAFVKAPIRKIKINEIAETFRHPYLRPHQTRVIVSYRTQHGNYKTLDDLKPIRVLDEATIQKIGAYLEF